MLEDYKKLLIDIREETFENIDSNIFAEINFINPLKLHWKEHIEFLERYYSEGNKRNLILGLNPGKDGCNKTGIAFTDPFNAINYLKMNVNYNARRERSSEKLFPLFTEAFENDINSFFNNYLLSNLLPFGAVKQGKQELINVKYEELLRIPLFKKWTEVHLDGLIKIFNPSYIIAVGEGVHKSIRQILRYKYPQIIVIQAAHPAIGTFFTNVEKERWIKILKTFSLD